MSIRCYKRLTSTLFLILITFIYSLAQSNSSLMASYPCTGNFNDNSGNARHGTVSGAVLTADKHGNASGAYLFDGVDDFVTLPPMGNYSTFTLMARVKFTSAALMNIFSGYDAAWYPSVSQGKVAWYDGVTWRYSSAMINNNQWHDIAYIFNNGNYSIYVDGTIQYTGAANYPTGYINIIGKIEGSSQRYFNGALDDLRIYNIALDTDNINKIFNGYPVSWTGLKNMVVNADNALATTTTGTWTSDAVSLNVMKTGEDGSIRFVYTPGSEYRVSLSKFNNLANYELSDFMIYINLSGTITIQERTTIKGVFGNAVAGDQFEIRREGLAIKYFKNDTLLLTTTLVENNNNLRVDVTVNRGTAPPVLASFGPLLMLLPKFQFPDRNNQNGSIEVQAIGGQLPLSYLWSTNENTSSINNKSRGTYTLTVTDALGQMVSRSYYLGFPIDWHNLVRVAVNPDNSLSRTAAYVAYDGGASSTNILLPDTEGFVEFVIDEPVSDYFVGLSRTDFDQSYERMSYAYQLRNNGAIAVWEGVQNPANPASLVTGDVMRIAREGGTIKYYRNGILQRAIATTPARLYRVDVTTQSLSGRIPVITTSFDRTIFMEPALVNPDKDNANGSIAMTLAGTYEPSTIQWSTNETTSTITNKSRGIYTVTAADALAGRSVSRTYNLGYDISWNDMQNIKVEADKSLTKTIATGGWDAAAISSNSLSPSTEGWIEFVIGKKDQTYIISLSRSNSNPDHPSADYGILHNAQTGDVTIIESGMAISVVNNIYEGDVYKIARENGMINYYKNGTSLRSIATNNSYTLFAKTLVRRGGAPMVTASFTASAKTFYAIANGNWNNTATWSLTEGGPSSVAIPGILDAVNIKGYKVDVTSGVTCTALTITTRNNNTNVTVDGNSARLHVGTRITIQGENNPTVNNTFIVQNNGKVKVQSQ